MASHVLLGRVCWAPVALVGLMTSSIVASQPPSSRPTGTYRAVLIGVAGYQSSPVPHAADDAVALAIALIDQCGYDESNVRLISDMDGVADDPPTRQNILKATTWLATSAREADTIVLYFCGQLAVITQKIYLLPIEASEPSPDKAVALEEVCRILAASKARCRLLVLDVCHPGDNAARIGAEPQMNHNVETALRGLHQECHLLVSCGAVQSSLQLPGERAGLFARWLIEALTGGPNRQLDRNKDGMIALGEIYPHLRTKVRTEAFAKARQRQDPMLLYPRAPTTSAAMPVTVSAQEVHLATLLGATTPATTPPGSPGPPKTPIVSNEPAAAATPPRSRTERHFYCPDCDQGFSVSTDEARELLRNAARANPGKPAHVVCPKCGKYTGQSAYKCPKCGAYYPMSVKPGTSFPSDWRDQCPKCGYSEQRARVIDAVRKMKREGKYDPSKMPEFMRKAVEEAEKRGEFKD